MRARLHNHHQHGCMRWLYANGHSCVHMSVPTQKGSLGRSMDGGGAPITPTLPVRGAFAPTTSTPPISQAWAGRSVKAHECGWIWMGYGVQISPLCLSWFDKHRKGFRRYFVAPYSLREFCVKVPLWNDVVPLILGGVASAMMLGGSIRASSLWNRPRVERFSLFLGVNSD